MGAFKGDTRSLDRGSDGDVKQSWLGYRCLQDLGVRPWREGILVYPSRYPRRPPAIFVAAL